MGRESPRFRGGASTARRLSSFALDLPPHVELDTVEGQKLLLSREGPEVGKHLVVAT